jgi:hypothetical protein
LIEDHVDDSVTRGNTHSNVDKMDAECSSSGPSDMFANGVEDSTCTQSKSSHASVSLESISSFLYRTLLFPPCVCVGVLAASLN